MKQEKTGQSGPAHSPKLQMAALEIKEIMNKHDVAGVIDLFIPGFNEIVIKIDPSFSCVEVNELSQLRINPPIVDPSAPEIAKKKIADTLNMLGNIRIYLGQVSRVLTQADMAVRQQFDMMPKPGDKLNLKPSNGLS